LFEGFPENCEILKLKVAESIDFIHLFCKTQKELNKTILDLKPLLKTNGMLWVS
jgi:hypothetical protein